MPLIITVPDKSFLSKIISTFLQTIPLILNPSPSQIANESRGDKVNYLKSTSRMAGPLTVTDVDDLSRTISGSTRILLS